MKRYGLPHMPVCFSVSSVSIFMQMEKLRSVVPNLYVRVFVIISSNIKLSEPANVATSFMCLSFSGRDHRDV